MFIVDGGVKGDFWFCVLLTGKLHVHEKQYL